MYVHVLCIVLCVEQLVCVLFCIYNCGFISWIKRMMNSMNTCACNFTHQVYPPVYNLYHKLHDVLIITRISAISEAFEIYM